MQTRYQAAPHPAMKLQKEWYELLAETINSKGIDHLKSFLQKEREEYTIYPAVEQVFRAFALTPPDKTRVVIVGQDPYHRPRQAHGLSFSVPREIAPPPSLRNIFSELSADLGISLPRHGCLEKWAQQGILLLNTTLTVRAGQPGSHYGQGWETFTDKVIEQLSKRKRCIYLLWGKNAQQKATKIDRDKSLILTAGHPSPYSVKSFLGCKHFSKVNDTLQNWGEMPIDWNLEN